MNVNRVIMETLAPLGVPVAQARYNQNASTYIAFVEYHQAPWLNADDDELWTKHYFQIDVFSDGNYLQLVRDVKKRLKAVGFTRMFESETYDDDMKKYRKLLRMHYISKYEEE
ncbi:hypothetical protein [Alkalicoccus luteus]|uniref:Uncharacterized protein n=1 Tax=Alkalicoccus luteus TaxID=1237094 RepID=A0A969TUP8_9BACI|nr:hypothetical protein [Alkalicoccus luteus]NJP37191.1 hypothetical protein [Alkalicoccus luteus]